MNYRNPTVEEVAGDERFINWVKGNCTEDEKDFWRTLPLSHPSTQDKIDRAAILVKNIGKAEERLDPVQPQRFGKSRKTSWRKLIKKNTMKWSNKTLSRLRHYIYQNAVNIHPYDG